MPQQKQLSKKEIRELSAETERFGVSLSKKDNVVIRRSAGLGSFVFVNNVVCFFYHEDKLLPTLRTPHIEMKEVTVDQGAIKFVVNGADIMRPGITKIDEGINKGDFVLVKEEVHVKAIAIGISLYSYGEMLPLKQGICVENIHYVGDKIWVNYKNSA